MVNKKGYLKTLEAVLAIVIILLFTFAVTPKPEPSFGAPFALKSAQSYILSEVERNGTIRTLVMGSDKSEAAMFEAESAIDLVVKDNIPPGFGYTFGICDLSVCVSNITPIAMERSIYAGDVLIASNETVQNPKVVRLWMWRLGA